jgi:hypothetical protein
MAPSIADAITSTADQIHEKVVSQKPIVEAQHKESSDTAAQGNHREPLKLSGALDQFESFDVTPIIGREFVDVNLADWIKAPNSDELLRDLAITSQSLIAHSRTKILISSAVSQRGVVFFRKQDDITNDIQKELVQRLGELSGKPATSKLVQYFFPLFHRLQSNYGKISTFTQSLILAVNTEIKMMKSV